MFVPQITVTGKGVPRLIVLGSGVVYEAKAETFPVWHVITTEGRSLGSFLSRANAESERKMLLRKACKGKRLRILQSMFQIDGLPVGVLVVPERGPDQDSLKVLDETLPFLPYPEDDDETEGYSMCRVTG